MSNKKLLIIESDSSNETSSSEHSLPRNPTDTTPKDSELENLFIKGNCDNEINNYSKNCNKFILKKEMMEREYLDEHPDENNYLYPNLNDPNFIIKIAEKKEFNETKYDGKIHNNIKEYSDIMSKADFELAPHQAFVRNFLSFQTPYNSLLLYHGLGSGKTCSAIGVCEEMRDYVKQVGVTTRIIIVASENVQDNFKLQLFDERKLKNIDGVWNIKGCIGNKLLKEINPNNMAGLTREKIITQIKNLINSSYLFLGYGQFANYIIKTATIEPGSYKTDSERKRKMINKLKNEFNNRLIVIDEIHNIKMTEDNENRKVAVNLEILVKAAENMRLLLLSATPMYNSYKEIIWLLNLMNINDRRGSIEEGNVFDKNGNFKPGGEDILIQKATGYISYVRGENPYTFPYRIYPNEFDITSTFKKNLYPEYQMNGKKIDNDNILKILDLYLLKIGNIQSYGYKYIIDFLFNKRNTITTKTGKTRVMPTFENMESFGYTLLIKPLEALNIIYPYDGIEEEVKKITDSSASELYEDNADNADNANNVELIEEPSSELSISSFIKGGDRDFKIDPKILTGTGGLKRLMNFVDSTNPPEKGKFEYKSSKYGRIFSPTEIGKYSCKIKNILDNIISPSGVISDGIILIYSQYIDGGLIPVALALEEMGFTRYGENVHNLFKDKPSPPIDVRTMKPKQLDGNTFMPARYCMITGDTRLSPNNDYEVKGITSEDNKSGNKVKVILISKAGSEGIDLKFIRQVHILEPWYNMNRTEQTIGRAVRNFSHKDLPFEKRNVQIFMYATLLEDEKTESADLYVYRAAEYKSVQIGRVSRVLKETAVDCIINHDQTNFTRENMEKNLVEPVTQVLSNGLVLNDFKIGDAPFSAACDYMPTCNYTCRPNADINENKLNEDTYNENFIIMNSDKIIQKIRLLMKESFFYKKKVLLDLIDIPKKYPLVQKYAALSQMIDDSTVIITDKYDRSGHLINIEEYYLFQPNELNFKNISIFDRSVPIDYKHKMINFKIKNTITAAPPPPEYESIRESHGANIIKDLKANYDLAKEYEQSDIKVKRGDDNWFKYCGVIMKKLETGGIQSEILDELLIDHIFDSLLFQDKLVVINYLYAIDSTIEESSFEFKSIHYFRRNSITFKNINNQGSTTAILLYDITKTKNKEHILIFNNDENKWVEAEPEDKNEILESVKVREKWIIKPSLLNKLVGFIGYEKQNRYLVFKIRDNESKRNSGARCDEAGKSKTIKTLNEIVGEERYTSENTKGLVQMELCCLQEFILRYFNHIKKDNKIWFLNSDIALFNKF
jgi:superfamily II DNA or RNA helicase